MAFRIRGLVAAAAVCAALVAWEASAQATPVFQPGFHQALRWSEAHSSVVTYRLKVPIGRAGNRIRLSFMAGDGSLTVHKATVARLDGSGMTAASFDGQASRTAPARQVIKTDPLSFNVAFGEELYVSFEVSGHLGTSSILALPGSFRWSGRYASAFPGPSDGAWYRATGLATVEVESAPSRAFVALGDSITEGYVNGNVWTYSSAHDDYRNAWPAVFQKNARVPVANAGVSGQGLYEQLQYLDREVKSLNGVTDCVILLGTNDLGSASAEQIQSWLTQLFGRLSGFCRVWVSTLLPKEATQEGNYQTIVTRRHAVNGWIRALTQVEGVVDLEAVTRGVDADHFKTGYAADHVHPSIEGQRAMGTYLASFFAEPLTINVETPLVSGDVPGLTEAAPVAVAALPATAFEPKPVTGEPAEQEPVPAGEPVRRDPAGCAALPGAPYLALATLAVLRRRRNVRQL